MKVLVAQFCLTLCDSMDYSFPGSSFHGILQARILQWVALLFSRGSSQPRDQTWVFLTAGRFCKKPNEHEFSSVQFSRSVMSDSLGPHESQHARPPCPTPTPGVHSNSTSIESVMPSSHLILCRPLLLLPPIPPSISLFQ